MNRRDFLQPRHLAHSAAHILGEIEAVADASDSSANLLLLHLRRGRWPRTSRLFCLSVRLAPWRWAKSRSHCSRAGRADDGLSRQQRNQPAQPRAFRSPVRVEKRLFDLLALAERIHRETEGAYDIAAGALIKAWGFFRGPQCVPDEAERAAAGNVRECNG